jgi:hypothetical protein
MHDVLPRIVRVDGSGVLATAAARAPAIPGPQLTSWPAAVLPVSCSYFKDEMQRAALEKLNQKRKWYQQQLEAERMMSKSIAKSKQVGRNGAGWLPMADDVQRGSQHPVRFALVLKPVCVPAAVGISNRRSWHGVPASWLKRTAVQLLLLLLLVAHMCLRTPTQPSSPPTARWVVWLSSRHQRPCRTHQAGATTWHSSNSTTLPPPPAPAQHSTPRQHGVAVPASVIWHWIGLERGCHPCATTANGTCS